MNVAHDFLPIDVEAAFRAARLLVDAYRRAAEAGGCVEWADVDDAYAAARVALGLPEVDDAEQAGESLG